MLPLHYEIITAFTEGRITFIQAFGGPEKPPEYKLLVLDDEVLTDHICLGGVPT